jgi:uncharacterized protein DUF5672
VHRFLPAGRRSTRSRTVAIIVPVADRDRFLAEEELSLRHLTHYLGAYDKYLLVPAGREIRRDGFSTLTIPRTFVGSPAAHGNMMMWRPLYRHFRRYEYLFLYHLDSLVFSGDLLTWCHAGYDYIGAPWLPCPETPWVTEAGVGNGGCTLFRVPSIRHVLRVRHRREPLTWVLDCLERNMPRLTPIYSVIDRVHRRWPRALLERVLAHRARALDPATYGTASDQFWSIQARRYVPSFRVASVDEALGFAFEAAPRECFERNGRRLPFGCHAWEKFDRAFWEPFLLRD